MDVKEAVVLAKDYVLTLFGEDGVADIRLEEIEHARDGIWNVTVGFVRPMAFAGDETQAGALMARLGGRYGPRVYRVVSIRDADGEVTSVKIREGVD